MATTNQQDSTNPFADLDPEELAETMDDFGGDMAAAADHLRRLRTWYTVPPVCDCPPGVEGYCGAH